ncbi:MAG: type I glyceraldehyde-3-phosphate dehydrogenase, partial [Patescibacteria group bacterium]
FGRIGRHALKAAWEKKGLQVVAINDLTDTKTLAHLLKYDTAYPDFPHKISHDERHIIVDGKKVEAFAEKDPAKLPWKKLKIDVVIESTGRFTSQEGASLHITAGAKKVVLSAPGKGEGIAPYLRGVNDNGYKGETIVDNASCTTNSVAPIMLTLEKIFGVAKAMMSTVHAYTQDQNLQDGPHKDLRRARAAAQNIIPTTTGAAVAVTRIMPSLKNKFDGVSFRVPTVTVSLTDLTVLLKKKTTVEEINKALTAASKTYLKGVMAVTNEPLVSSDFIGNPYSAVVDLSFTNVVDGDLVKIVAWYDNEWGYANRLVEMVEIVASKAH